MPPPYGGFQTSGPFTAKTRREVAFLLCLIIETYSHPTLYLLWLLKAELSVNLNGIKWNVEQNYLLRFFWSFSLSWIIFKSLIVFFFIKLIIHLRKYNKYFHYIVTFTIKINNFFTLSIKILGLMCLSVMKIINLIHLINL